MKINLYSPQVTSGLLLAPMFIPGWKTPVLPAGAFHGGIPLSIHSPSIPLYVVIDPFTAFATAMAAGDSVELFANGQPTGVIKIVKKGEENDRIGIELPWGWLVNGANKLFYRVTRLAGNTADSQPILDVLFHSPGPSVTAGHPASVVPGQLATFTFNVSYPRAYDELTLTVGTWSKKIPYTPPTNPVTYTLATTDIQQIGDGIHPVSVRVVDQLGNLNVSPTTSIDIRANQSQVAVQFLNGPYTIAPGGRVKDIELGLTQMGQPIEGVVTLVLPPGTTFADGTSVGSFTTQVDGLLKITNVKGAISAGSFPLTATSGTSTSTAVLTINAHGPLGAISLGTGPLAAVISSDGTRVYVSDTQSSLMTVIDTARSLVIGQIDGAGPVVSWDLAINIEGTRVYECKGSSSAGVNGAIGVLDTKHLILDKDISVEGFPIGVVLSKDEQLVFSSDWRGNTVYVTNTQTYRSVKAITVGQNPRGMAITPDGARVFVCNFSDKSSTGSVSVIDTQTLSVSGTTALQGSPYGVAASADGQFMFVGVWMNQQQHKGAIVQLSARDGTVLKTFPVEGLPKGVCTNPSGTLVHFCHDNVYAVASIDASSGTLIRYTGVGSRAYDMALSHDGVRAYVPCPDSNTVQVIALDQGAVSAADATEGYSKATSDIPRKPINGEAFRYV